MDLTGATLAKFEDMITNGGRVIDGIWNGIWLDTRNHVTCNCLARNHEICSGWILPIGGPAECACPCHDEDRPSYRVALARALKAMNHWRINDFVTIDGTDVNWKITFVDYRAKEVHATGPAGQVAIAEFDLVNLLVN